MSYIEFKNKYNNKYVDFDGAYGAQCWDLAQKYVTECLQLPSSILSGCGLVSNMLKEPKLSEMLKYFDEVKTTEMQAGDIVIWEVGHIAIYDHWDGNNCWYFSQNNEGTASKAKGASIITQCNLKGKIRAFRKKDSSTKTIKVPKGTKKIIIEIG